MQILSYLIFLIPLPSSLTYALIWVLITPHYQPNYFDFPACSSCFWPASLYTQTQFSNVSDMFMIQI